MFFFVECEECHSATGFDVTKVALEEKDGKWSLEFKAKCKNCGEYASIYEFDNTIESYGDRVYPARVWADNRSKIKCNW